MSPLYGFYLAALDAELAFAPMSQFSARMASFYCRMLMALEASPEDGTTDHLSRSGRPKSQTAREGR